mgnify:CR=1 FL=1
MVIDWISDGIGAISILVAVVFFFLDRQQTKKVNTIQELNQLFDRYYKLRDLSLNEHYAEYSAFTSEISRFAYAVKKRVYDKKIVKDRASRLFMQMEGTFLRSVIEKHRSQFKNDHYYSEIDELLEALKR